MNYITLFLKGLVIGIGKVIPGVSGALIAISFNVYERSIKFLSNPFKNLKKDFFFMLVLGLGIVLAISFFSNIIYFCLNNYYLWTMLLFIGLIMGCLKEIKSNFTIKNNLDYLKICFISIFFVIIMSINFNNANGDVSFYTLFTIGFIESIAMVIPGISGTAILMSLGYYDIYLSVLSSMTNINLFIFNFYNLVVLFLGIIFGIFVTSKIINYLFSKCYNFVYLIIYSCALSTIFLMFLLTLKYNYSFIEVIIGLCLLLIGRFLAHKFS